MNVRYPSYARRKQVAKHRDQVLKADVTASVGFDLDKWANPGRTSAAFGPFLVLCGMCPWQAQHDDYSASEAAQRAHYSKHYEAGETS